MTVRDSYPIMKKPDRFDPTRTTLDTVLLTPALASESELAGYLRTGGCTPGCGACCESFVVPINEKGLGHKDFKCVNSVGQIVLPVDEVVKNKEGMADWEHWLNLHEVYLFQSPDGLLTAEIPVEVSGPLPPWNLLDDWVTWLEQCNITVSRRQGNQLSAYVPVACTKLIDGMCSIVGTPEHPKMCSRYPRHPMDIEGLDFCTYKFQPILKTQLELVSVKTSSSSKPKRKKGKRSKKGGRNKKR